MKVHVAERTFLLMGVGKVLKILEKDVIFYYNIKVGQQIQIHLQTGGWRKTQKLPQ